MNFDTNHIIEELTAFFPNVQAIYIFGSHATGQATSSSDIDIALLFPELQSPSAVELFTQSHALAASINADVDLIDLRNANTVLQFQVIMNGLVIYKTNALAVDQFEMITMSMYQRLNEERKEILEQIQASGKIYS